MTDKNGMYRNSIIQYLLNSQWFASKEKSHRRSHDFEGQTMLPLVTLALILTAVRLSFSFIRQSLDVFGELMCSTIRFLVPLTFGRLAKRFPVNSTGSLTGLDTPNISRNSRRGLRSVLNPHRLNRRGAMIFVQNCAKICFGIHGKSYFCILPSQLFYVNDCFQRVFTSYCPAKCPQRRGRG